MLPVIEPFLVRAVLARTIIKHEKGTKKVNLNVSPNFKG